VTLQLPWRRRQAFVPAEARSERCKALLLAAYHTRYYRPLLEAAGFPTPEAIARSGPIEDMLALLPRTSLSARRAGAGAFRNRLGPKLEPQRLFVPAPAPARTALLMPGFQSSGSVRVFEKFSRGDLARYKPDALAGPVGILRQLAEGVEDRGAWAPRLEHSVIAFSAPQGSFLSREAQDLFWRVFQAPVFGQLLGLADELLAWECEAHDGYHVVPENAVFETDGEGNGGELLVTSLVNLRRPVLKLGTGLTAGIEYSACDCGQSGWRLVGVRRRSFGRAAMAAGVACAAEAGTLL